MMAAVPSFVAWRMAARPRTLSLSVVPVAVGTAVVWGDVGRVSWGPVLVALAGAVCIQLATNLHNDAADFKRGADGTDRLGPPRVTAQGLLSAARVTAGAWVCFGLAALAGLYLVAVGGWPILALGGFSILAGWGYTGGPRPIAYTPLGEVFVLGFFGVGAVGGTVWLQTGHLSRGALVSGIALGLFAAAVLLTNNHRDRVADAGAGRHTLALVIGKTATVRLYGLFMLVPFALLPLLPHGHAWLAFGALPLALRLVLGFSKVEGRGYNRVLAATAQVQLVFGLLLCLGLTML